MTDRQIATKAYLNRVHIMDQKAEALNREQTSLKKYLHSESQAVIEFGRLVNDEVAMCYDLMQKTKEIIEQVDAKYYALLSHRYIGCMGWNEIENLLHISESSRKRLHCEALDAVADVLEKLDLFEPLDPPYHDIRE